MLSLFPLSGQQIDGDVSIYGWGGCYDLNSAHSNKKLMVLTVGRNSDDGEQDLVLRCVMVSDRERGVRDDDT